MNTRMELQTKTQELKQRSSQGPDRIRRKIGLSKLKDIVESDKVTVMGSGKDALVRVRTTISIDVRSAALLPGVDSGILSLKYVEIPKRIANGSLEMDKFFEVRAVPSQNSYAFSENETLAKLLSVAYYLADILPLEQDIRDLKRKLGPADEPKKAGSADHNVIRSDPLDSIRGSLNLLGGCRPRSLRDLL